MTKGPRTLEQLEIVGGDLCLDFANTVNVRPAPEHDYLSSYQALLDWSAKVVSLEPPHLQQLAVRGAAQPDAAQAVLVQAHALRDSIYRVFAQIVAQHAPDAIDLAAVQQHYNAACLRSQLVWQGSRARYTWIRSMDLETALAPVAYAAGELLRSDDLGALKRCPSCGWLFLDRSKNGQRRWCSMNSCGVRDKMQRYHQRQRDRTDLEQDIRVQQ
jgi:predicted RNA-binding Zn ribbon-like protein